MDPAAEVFSAADFPTDGHQLRLWMNFVAEVGIADRAPIRIKLRSKRATI
jgi:hypothetical protein